MTFLLAIALFASAAPVQTQGELPEWLLGTWCRPPARGIDPANDQKWYLSPAGTAPGHGGQCISWTRDGENRLSGRSEIGLSGLENQVTYYTIERVDGRLSYRIDEGPPMWEAAHAPNDIVFVRNMRDRSDSVRIIRTGNVMVIHAPHAPYGSGTRD